jgi:hypothetical protein
MADLTRKEFLGRPYIIFLGEPWNVQDISFPDDGCHSAPLANVEVPSLRRRTLLQIACPRRDDVVMIFQYRFKSHFSFC